MGISNDDFGKMSSPEPVRRPLVTDEQGAEVDLMSAFEPPADAGGGEDGDADEIGFLDSETFGQLPPEAQRAFKQRLKANSKLEKKLDRIAEQMQQLASENATLKGYMEGSKNGNGRAKADPSDITEFSEDALKGWRAQAWRTIRAARGNPDNTELQEEALKAEEGLSAVDAELMRRTAENAANSVRSEFQAQRTLADRQSQAMRYLASEGVPTDVLVNQDSEVREAARERAEKVARALGIGNDKPEALLALEVMALAAEAKAGDRAKGGLPPSVRRQLGIEGAQRGAALGGRTPTSSTGVFGGSSESDEVKQVGLWLAANGMV